MQGQGQGPSLQGPGQGQGLDLQGQGQGLTSLQHAMHAGRDIVTANPSVWLFSVSKRMIITSHLLTFW